MPLFATLTSERMCFAIDAAKRHIILAAPGIGMPMANALLSANQRLSKDTVARLGYDEHAAVEMLAAANVSLHMHPGLRIGVLICAIQDHHNMLDWVTCAEFFQKYLHAVGINVRNDQRVELSAHYIHRSIGMEQVAHTRALAAGCLSSRR